MTSQYEDTVAALGIAISANVPVILWGDPGQGKTSVLNAIAKDYGFHMETVISSIREPSDFAGLPAINPVTGAVQLAPPNWALNIKNKGEEGITGIVFYDEISTAPPAVQAALLRPILDNCVGDLQLPEGVRTVAAANPTDIAAGGWDMSLPMANRFLHLDWELPADVVRDGFTIGWPTVNIPVPDETAVEREITKARVLVGSFLGVRQESVTVLPEDVSNDRAFPTPRSWEQVAILYGFAKACGDINDNVIQMLLSGSIGIGATGEFITFVAELDLPDPEKLIREPETFNPPDDRGDKMYAIAASIYAALNSNVTPQRWQNVAKLLSIVAEHNYDDIAYVFARRWINLRPENELPDIEVAGSFMRILKELNPNAF